MARLGCICGHTIVDQSDYIPYKGHILPDVEVDNVSQALVDIIDSLSETTNQSQQPGSLRDSLIIHDKISLILVNKKQDIFECKNCGRIAIQVGQSKLFKFYKPESNEIKGIFDNHA